MHTRMSYVCARNAYDAIYKEPQARIHSTFSVDENAFVATRITDHKSTQQTVKSVEYNMIFRFPFVFNCVIL